jgi:hypothetical protein
MAADHFRYDLLVQNAMRGVVRKVLAKVAARGSLPGDHHFMISFRTDAPGVKISRRLAEEWPQEMTIILQHQFYNLVVDDVGFSVSLSFRAVPETLYVPYAALRAFSDPSVPFGFKFNVDGEEEESEEESPAQKRRGPTLVRRELEENAPTPAKAAKTETLHQGADKPEPAHVSEPAVKQSASDKIVSIDAFRKKP